MTISEQIKQRRLDKGWSMRQVADRAGVSRQRIHQIESGDISNLSAIRNIAAALECDVQVTIQAKN